MNKENEFATYMMAAEKIGNLIFTIESTMEFMGEYDVKPDEEVIKVLTPLVNHIKKWINDGK
jgi:hypothetical protein